VGIDVAAVPGTVNTVSVVVLQSELLDNDTGWPAMIAGEVDVIGEVGHVDKFPPETI
jgi:hypothetical protein